MASFEDVLNENDVAAIQQFLVSVQTDLYEEQEKELK